MASSKIKDERGLSIAVLLAILAIAGLLVGLGLYVRHRESDAASSTAASQSKVGSASQAKSTTKPPKPATPATASSTTIPAPNNNAINIPALGADITVSDSIKDLNYYVASNSGGQVVVNFSTQTLTAAIPGCAADQGTGAFDSIERGPGQYPGPANASSGGLLKQYPTYYLAYILPAGPCATGLSTQNQTLLDDQQEDFYTALSTVQATQ